MTTLIVIFSVLLLCRLFNIKFERRKSWSLSRTRYKRFQVYICGFNQAPHISFELDGEEREAIIHIAAFIGIWIIFENVLPKSWYPTRQTHGYGKLPDTRVFKIYWYEWAIWWTFWMPRDRWDSTDPRWRCKSIDFRDLLRGKHTCSWKQMDVQEFLLPFLEGAYRVTVIKKLRTDSYRRWFTKTSISYEIKAGYWGSGKTGEVPTNEWIECPIPHEGKGESSYDQDEDGTYSMSMHSSSLERKEQSSLYDVALYFWTRMMQQRKKYGYDRWVPRAYRDKMIPVISAPEKATVTKDDGSADATQASKPD
jgi:hypothetical protein